MARFRALLRAISLCSSLKRIVPEAGRLGIGFALVAALSLVFALVAQAQTDSGESGVPRLTIARSHASVVKGEEATFTITASSAPSADLEVYVQVQATVRERSLYQSQVIVVSMAAGERTIEFIAETGGSEVGEGTLTLDVSILGGSGYRLGDTPVAGVRVTDPPPAAGTRQGVPAAPSGFTASAVAEDSIAVSWTGVAGVSRYRLEEHVGSVRVDLWRVVGGQGSIAQTSATVAGLRSGTQYQYRVRAYNAAGWGVPSASASATTQGVRGQTTDLVGVRAAPDPPTGFSASAPNHFTIKASWNASTGANCYRFGVWIHTIGYPAGWHYKNTTKTSYTWTGGIDRGTTYDIRVAAATVDDCPPDETIPAEWSADSWLKVTTPRPDPPAPSGFSGSATGTHSISASWDRVVGASKYEFGIKTGTPGSWSKPKEVLSPATSTTWSTGLAPNTTYEIRVRAHGDRHWLAFVWGPYSEAEVTTDTSTPPPQPTQPPPTATPTPVRLAAPDGVTIIPLPQRKARLKWDAVTDADTYVVEAREKQAGASWVDVTSDGVLDSANATYDFSLDDIVINKGLAHDPYAYQFRIKAQDSANAVAESAFSAPVTVIDTPITRADGNSPAGGQATLRYTPLETVLNDASYARGSYSFRYRRLGNSGGRHTSLNWKPDNPVDARTTSDNPITGLTLYEVYAIQLRYEKPGKERVYAARDVYVWPSNRAAGNGERVATFPLNYPLTRTASGTYEFRYRICEDTFAGLNNSQSDWIAHINHAFMQWQLATGGLVRMVEEAGPCADYSPFVTHVVNQITPMLPAMPTPADRDRIAGQVTAMVGVFRTIGLIDLVNFERHTLAQPIQDDISRNEVIMVNDTDLAIDITTTNVLTEFSKDLGFAQCDGGCAHRSDNNGGSTTDIFLKRKTHDQKPDGTRRILINLTGVDKVVFNTCPNTTNNYNYPYSSLVHEAGHALGIRAAFEMAADPDFQGHPSIADSIMNYNQKLMLVNEKDCSPHPLDIMAIYAIYQTGP